MSPDLEPPSTASPLPAINEEHHQSGRPARGAAGSPRSGFPDRHSALEIAQMSTSQRPPSPGASPPKSPWAGPVFKMDHTSGTRGVAGDLQTTSVEAAPSSSRADAESRPPASPSSAVLHVREHVMTASLDRVLLAQQGQSLRPLSRER